MNTAKFVKEVTITDPDTGGDVGVAIYKHENGGLFGVDSSYIDQVIDEDKPVIRDPLNKKGKILLID